MIFKGSDKVGNGRHARDQYTRKAKKSPQAMVNTIGSKFLVGHAPQLDDIIFTKADAGWVHYPMKMLWLLLPRLPIASSINC